MSLVNDMLRDLNKRTPVSNNAARVNGAIQSSINSKKVKVRTGLILVGGLLAGLAGGYVYFESMGVQVVQVPLAVVPAQVQPSSPPAAPSASASVASSSATAPAATAERTNAADVPAVESVVEIRELAMQPNGFTLLVGVSQDSAFEIRDRSAYGLTLHIDGVDRYDRSGTTVPGMSLLLVSDGLDLGIELDDPADFLVREDTETAGFDILITVSYRPDDVTNADSSVPEPQVASTTQTPAPATEPPPVVATNSAPATQATATVPASERQTPVRVSRELSFDERDRNNSQAALRAVQGGQMTEAYRLLLAFIEENPDGHQSRETLAKLLMAQQEYAQAGVIVDQGIARLPTHSAFRKIKARLLMQANDNAQALELLRGAPPAVATDAEYHELLATLYQQGSSHQQAVSTYQALLRTDRTQGRWWAGLGISLEAQDLDADALTSYQAALQTTNLDASLRKYVQDRVASLGNQQ